MLQRRALILAAVLLTAGAFVGFCLAFPGGQRGNPGWIGILLALLALGCVVFGAVLQNREFERQRDLLRQQSFENAFFQLLGHHHQIVAMLDLSRPGTDSLVANVRGRECFNSIYRVLREAYKQEKERIADADSLELIEESYGMIFQAYGSELTQYFANLRNLVRFLKKSDMRHNRFYADTIAAQLSKLELLLLFYHCLSPLGKKDFKPLLEEFHLLQNMDHSALVDPSHDGLYEPTAYGQPE